jgi:hypothetical protein
MPLNTAHRHNSQKKEPKKNACCQNIYDEKQHAIKFLANKKLVDLTFNRKSRTFCLFLTRLFSLTINYIPSIKIASNNKQMV